MISNRDPQACIVETCEPIKNAHRLIGCTGKDCRGCLPRNAEPGILVCTACRLRVADRLTELGLGTVHAADPGASRTLPSLHDALLQPSRIPSATRGGKGDERPLQLAEDALKGRDVIERVVTEWAAELTRRFNVWSVPPPLVKPVIAYLRSAPHDATVKARTAFVLAHLRELLADPEHADQVVHDVDWAWIEARRRAYPQPPAGHVIGACPVGTGDGPCGGEVRAIIDSIDEDGWARCKSCKTSADIDYWLALMPSEAVDWLPMRALRWHLTLHASRQISDVTIRSWARDPAALPARRVGVVPYAGEVTAQTAGRVEYRVTDALQLAELGRRRGRPPGPPRPRRPVDDTVETAMRSV